MVETPSDEECLNLYYCYYLEYMSEIFHRRTANLISFLQVILGGTIMADLSKGFILGLIVTILSAYMFVYKPGEVASQAKQQSKRYERLMHRLPDLNAAELRTAFGDLTEFDSPSPGSLQQPAYIRALIARGHNDPEVNEQRRRMSRIERLCAFFSGGIPH